MDQLRMYRGDSREIQLPLSLDGVAWSIPVDATIVVTGKTNLAQEDNEAAFTKTNGDGVSFSTNIVTIQLDPEDTSWITKLTPQTLECDVQVSSPTIGPWTVARFQLVVDPDVTRT